MNQKTVLQSLCYGRDGAPKENRPLTPFQAGVTRALQLQVGEPLLLAQQYAEEQGYTVERHGFEVVWQFVDGFLGTLGYIGLALDRDGKVLSFTRTTRTRLRTFQRSHGG